jgi:TrmH family RNA methyltransferase
MVLDAIDVARLVPRLILVSEDAFDAPLGGDLLLALRDEAFAQDISLIHPDLMKAVSDTKNPQGVLGVFERPQHAPTLSEDAQVLVLDRVMDPGNMGTLVRTAYGLGWDAVMAVECTDPFGSKAVRSSMGACLLMPVLECSWGPGGVADSGVGVGAVLGDRPVFIAELIGASNPHFEADLSGACALVIGSEATGIGDDARTALSVPQSINVPLARDLESLNAAVAGAIIMGEASRQRFGPSS